MYLPRTFTRATYQFPRRKFIPRFRVTTKSISSTLALTDKISFKKVHFPRKNSIFTEILSSSFSPDGQTEIDILESSFDYDLYSSRSLSSSLNLNDSVTDNNVLTLNISDTLSLTPNIFVGHSLSLITPLSLTQQIGIHYNLNLLVTNSLVFISTPQYNISDDYIVTSTLTLIPIVLRQIVSSQQVSQSLSLSDLIINIPVYNVLSNLNLNQSFTKSLGVHLTDTLTFTQYLNKQLTKSLIQNLNLTQDISLSPAKGRSIVHNLLLTQSISKNSLTQLSYQDTLNFIQNVMARGNLQIQFTTISQSLVLPVPELVTAYPYYDLNIPVYGLIDTRFSNKEDFTQTVLFDVLLQLTYQERKNLQKYFSYYRYNKFNIDIHTDSWVGYLTTNNQDLFQSQFRNGISELIIQFEATLVRKG